MLSLSPPFPKRHDLALLQSIDAHARVTFRKEQREIVDGTAERPSVLVADESVSSFNPDGWQNVDIDRPTHGILSTRPVSSGADSGCCPSLSINVNDIRVMIGAAA